MKLTKFWRIFLISLASVLFLALVGGGVYVYLKDPFGYKIPKLDKYSDVVNWCNTSVKDSKLNIGCKSLLLDIRNTEDGNSCFDIQIITKDKELKDLTVCEKGDTLSYTNDVLGYKKLMPLDISFSYSKEGILNSYVFSNVSLEPMGEEYIHSIVNEDIASLVQTDVESVTTIKNSVNFCPRPEQLPEYVTEDNKSAYEEFYLNEIIKEDIYDIGSFYNLGDEVISILLVCNSQTASNNTEFCKNLDINIDNNIRQEIQTIVKNEGIYNTGTLSTEDITVLKKITLLNAYTEDIAFSDPSSALFSVLKTFTSNSNLNIVTLFSIVNMLTQIEDSQNIISSDIEKIKENITLNTKDLTSALSLPLIYNDDIDSIGLYLRLYVNYPKQDKNLDILNNCMNLYALYE